MFITSSTYVLTFINAYKYQTIVTSYFLIGTFQVNRNIFIEKAHFQSIDIFSFNRHIFIQQAHFQSIDTFSFSRNIFGEQKLCVISFNIFFFFLIYNFMRFCVLLQFFPLKLIQQLFSCIAWVGQQQVYIYICMYVCMYDFYLNKLFKLFIFSKEIIMIIKILFSNYTLSFGYHTKYV